MIDRRTLLLGSVPILWPLDLSAQQSLLTVEHRQAVSRGLRFLVNSQTDDGAFGSAEYERNLAVISLAGLAFVSAGHLPERGPYGKHVSLMVDFVMRHAQETGVIGSRESNDRGPMYGHGFSTLFLAQVFGVSRQKGLRAVIENGVKLIVRTQNDEGGWRYEPQKGDADISVTVCQVLALRAARNAGLYVPPATIDACRRYVTALQNSDGGFRYTSQPGESAYGRTASALVSLQSLGWAKKQVLKRGVDYLMQHIPSNQDYAGDPHYFYGQYYAAHALYQSSGNSGISGKPWKDWYAQTSTLLLEKQQTNGAWQDDFICDPYATAMACLILQMPSSHLPALRK
jgi:prenyltransferase beta subunit